MQILRRDFLFLPHLPECMKKVLILIPLILVVLVSRSQKDTTNQPKFQNLGFLLGATQGVLRLDSRAVFIPNTSRVLSASPVSAWGIHAGVFYNIEKENWIFRPALEASIINSHIKYDVQKTLDEEGYIYPVSIEVPLHIMYKFNNKFVPDLLVGARAIFANNSLKSLEPPTTSFTPNFEVGISKKTKLGKKNSMRFELLYSRGITDLHQPEAGNEYSESINSVFRDFLSIRIYFN